MSFTDKNIKDDYSFNNLNDEQKIRVTLSKHADYIIATDMEVFSVDQRSSFVNHVFKNFYEDSIASVSLYRQERELYMSKLLEDSGLEEASIKSAVNCLIAPKEEKILDELTNMKNDNSGESFIFRLNDKNVSLLKQCGGAIFYKNKPSVYIKCILEDYCSRSPIERLRIYRKETYQKIKEAISENRLIKVTVSRYDQKLPLTVYPYKIARDELNSQEYLVCYSKEDGAPETTLSVSSFSMSRLVDFRVSKARFRLSKAQKDEIEKKLSLHSPAYFFGGIKEIKIRLSPNGCRKYKARPYSRPRCIKKEEAGNKYFDYYFECSEQQVIDYFFVFGKDAEIIYPADLRNNMMRKYKLALDQYYKT